MSHDPRTEYERRLAARRDVAAVAARREQALSHARLAVFVAGGLLAWLAFGPRVLSPFWIALAALAFVALVLRHLATRRDREKAERAVRFYEEGLARIRGEWVGRGNQGERFRDPEHVYAEDLDLFGKGSLFELLATVRTWMGEDALASWLTAPAVPEEIRARQAAVDELRGRLDLREEIALLGEEVRGGLEPARLASWGAGEVWRAGRRVRISVAALSGTTLLVLLALLAWFDADPGAWIPRGAMAIAGASLAIGFVLLLLVEGAVALAFHRRVRAVVEGVGRPDKDLVLLAELLERIERERFEAPRLAGIVRALETGGVPPSRRIAALHRRIEWLDSEKNQFVAPFRPILLLSTQLAFSIEAWRVTCGAALEGWLRAAGEFEALCALSLYAYEHPRDPFPEILAEGPRLEAEGIAHPILPEDRAVANDLAVGGERRLLVVSGSNMSGKSTLLRTVGANAVLALAGAPVRARRLALSPLDLGASIRLADSLLAGHSRFYAEITRLRAIVERADRSAGLLFLVDEIFAGTNSHDRAIGAEAVLRAIVEKNAIGLVTTHDLALARVADELAPRAANVHFVDHIEDGRMVFDYRLREGVVAKSNALELMRAVGLPV